MRTITRFLPICLIAIGSTLHAQDKGFVSGTVSFVTQKVDEEGTANDVTHTNGTFGPAVGFNLAPQHVVGLALNITGNTTKYKVDNGGSLRDATDKTSLAEIAPFYRYVKSVGDKFSLYGQFKVGFGFGKQTHDVDGLSDQPEIKVSTFRAGIGPGIVFVPATRWALSADWGLLGYKSETDKVETNNDTSKTTTSGFEATLNPGAITLALNWLF